MDAVIRRQGLKDEADRRGVYVVVDEMQTIPGVNFQGMLSEIRKSAARSVWLHRVSLRLVI